MDYHSFHCPIGALSLLEDQNGQELRQPSLFLGRYADQQWVHYIVSRPTLYCMYQELRQGTR